MLPISMKPRINYYNALLKKQFNGRVQKISINAGCTCPNRDGSIGVGGCTYCNNQAFYPDYCQPAKSITQQIEDGFIFFGHKYENKIYLAYFQAYTNTYGDNQHLISYYEEALAHPKIDGLVVGTRPDCMNDTLLEYFAQKAKTNYIMIEYGVESVHDKTLTFINRGHTFDTSCKTIYATANKGIHIGAHLILGLPFESHQMMMESAKTISKLPLDMLKLHQLQIVRGTLMSQQYAQHPEWFTLFTLNNYIDLAIDFIEYLSPSIAIERFVSQSPKDLLIAPDWGIKNYEFTEKINKRIIERESYQGRFFQVK